MRLIVANNCRRSSGTATSCAISYAWRYGTLAVVGIGLVVSGGRSYTAAASTGPVSIVSSQIIFGDIRNRTSVSLRLRIANNGPTALFSVVDAQRFLALKTDSFTWHDGQLLYAGAREQERSAKFVVLPSGGARWFVLPGPTLERPIAAYLRGGLSRIWYYGFLLCKHGGRVVSIPFCRNYAGGNPSAVVDCTQPLH
jgi:hypothetical protein